MFQNLGRGACRISTEVEFKPDWSSVPAHNGVVIVPPSCWYRWFENSLTVRQTVHHYVDDEQSAGPSFPAFVC